MCPLIVALSWETEALSLFVLALTHNFYCPICELVLILKGFLNPFWVHYSQPVGMLLSPLCLLMGWTDPGSSSGCAADSPKVKQLFFNILRLFFVYNRRLKYPVEQLNVMTSVNPFSAWGHNSPSFNSSIGKA